MNDSSLDSTEEVRGLVRAGRAAIRLGDYQAAQVAFEQAVARDPQSVEAQDGLAEARRRLGVAATERSSDVVEYCYRHPDVETGLHCVQCGRPICARCSFPAAVGQLCPDCRKGRRSVNYQVSSASLLKAGGAGIVAGALGYLVTSFIPFFFLFFIGPSVGEIVLRVVDWATRNKRGRGIQIAACVGILAGTALVYFFRIQSPLNALIFLVLSIGTAATRLR